MTEQIATALVGQGLPGIVILALAWAYWRKDAELKRANDARLEDAKRNAEQQLAREDRWFALFDRKDDT